MHSVRTTAYAQSPPYGQTGCPGLDLRGKRTRMRHSIQDLELHERDRRPVDLEIMIHKERRVNGKLLRRESTKGIRPVLYEADRFASFWISCYATVKLVVKLVGVTE